MNASTVAERFQQMSLALGVCWSPAIRTRPARRVEGRPETGGCNPKGQAQFLCALIRQRKVLYKQLLQPPERNLALVSALEYWKETASQGINLRPKVNRVEATYIFGGKHNAPVERSTRSAYRPGPTLSLDALSLELPLVRFKVLLLKTGHDGLPKVIPD